jgi:predicted metal-dependent peptidase
MSKTQDIVETEFDKPFSDQDSETLASDDEMATVEKNGIVTTKDSVYLRGRLDSDFFQFFQQEPFLAGLCVSLTKLIDEKMPTAYVGVRPNGKSHEVVMGINPKFFDSLTGTQKHGVLRHEIYHLIFQHIFTRAIGEHSYSMLWNWATDMAINSIIGYDNLPSMVICPGHRPIDPKTGKPIDGKYADFIANAPPMMASDWYFSELRKIQDEQNDGNMQIAIGSGIGTMDDHSGWGDLPAEVQEQIKDKINGMIEKGVIKAQKTNQWGTVPQEVREAIQAMISREIDWRSIVRNFMGRVRTTLRNSTIRKINKKMPYLFPGVKRPMIASFACFIDQSGSMSDEDISLLFGELESFSKETSLDVFHFDTEIDEKSHTVWKRGMPHPAAHRTRSGGTDFNAVADFVNSPQNRGRWSGVVILTDGYAPTMGAVNGSKVLWVITESGTTSAARPGDLIAHMKRERSFKRV